MLLEQLEGIVFTSAVENDKQGDGLEIPGSALLQHSVNKRYRGLFLAGHRTDATQISFRKSLAVTVLQVLTLYK